MAETRQALDAFRRGPLPDLAWWLLLSLAIALALLGVTLLVAGHSSPGGFREPLGLTEPVRVRDVGFAFFNNSLVLLFHALVCVAVYLARRSLPAQALLRTGVDRWIHENAGRAAMPFVLGTVCFSLSIQAINLGHAVADVGDSFSASPATVILGVLPHALIELTAVFLPLAAAILLGRRQRWNEFLAVSVFTGAVAVPLVLAAAFIETYVSPHLMRGLLL